MKKEKYMFLVGEENIIIESYNEQEALRLLGVNHWHQIKKARNIKLLGSADNENN